MYAFHAGNIVYMLALMKFNALKTIGGSGNESETLVTGVFYFHVGCHDFADWWRFSDPGLFKN